MNDKRKNFLKDCKYARLHVAIEIRRFEQWKMEPRNLYEVKEVLYSLKEAKDALDKITRIVDCTN